MQAVPVPVRATPDRRRPGASCPAVSAGPPRDDQRARGPPAPRARVSVTSGTRTLSVGEPLSDGIGRPAPAIAEAGPRCRQLSVSAGAAPSLRPPRSRRPCVSRSAATFDTGPGAGGRASAFRTAHGICPRPVVCHPGPRRHGHETLRRTGSRPQRSRDRDVFNHKRACKLLIESHFMTFDDK